MGIKQVTVVSEFNVLTDGFGLSHKTSRADLAEANLANES